MDWMIYGANGYTGELIVREAKRKGKSLLVGGRNAAKAHYLDITGEIDVLEGAHRFDADARAAGVVLCPGAGFDVVPTDCVALMLKKALPGASELALGFEVTSRRMSAGTAKTTVEGLGKGS